MAWVKTTDRQLINLDKIEGVIKSDILLNDTTTYEYGIIYTYPNNEIGYKQVFVDEATRDSFFVLIETKLDPIRNDG